LGKQITLQGNDTGSGMPIIDGSGSGNVITLNSNGCIVDGFVIRNGQNGIIVYSNGNTISDNSISGNGITGIIVYSANNNHIVNNVISNNQDGILMHSSGSSNNEISANTVTYNNRGGIMLGFSAHNNIVSNNDASHNGQTTLGDGIYVYLCDNLIISGSTASYNHQDGIYIQSGNNNTISGNTAIGNARSGIGFSTGSSNCTVSGNTITGNSLRGIEVTSSSGNTFFTNILSNSHNAESNSVNNWNSTANITWTYGGRTLSGLLGNVWSNYGGLDCNNDGIGDTPYNIAGGSEKDYHPIGGTPCSPELVAEKIANRSEAGIGDWIS
jgi:parallel beta-helix repeat protein